MSSLRSEPGPTAGTETKPVKVADMHLDLHIDLSITRDRAKRDDVGRLVERLEQPRHRTIPELGIPDDINRSSTHIHQDVGTAKPAAITHPRITADD